MNLESFRDRLESLRDSELFRYVQRCVCMSLAHAGEPHAESHDLLDLVYAECARRGKERLYDKAYERVCKEPDVCKGLLA
ncbi:MAG: hypothetical protein D6809_05085 [Gammaproteobacteria bacterium]|nr:MAG: hypothetical protein D6809_05085 [Gammaproteobacteria bacterium]